MDKYPNIMLLLLDATEQFTFDGVQDCVFALGWDKMRDVGLGADNTQEMVMLG